MTGLSNVAAAVGNTFSKKEAQKHRMIQQSHLWRMSICEGGQVGLGFELSASRLLGRSSTAWAPPPALTSRKYPKKN
jgi:hypothetical protein